MVAALEPIFVAVSSPIVALSDDIVLEEIFLTAKSSAFTISKAAALPLTDSATSVSVSTSLMLALETFSSLMSDTVTPRPSMFS